MTASGFTFAGLSISDNLLSGLVGGVVGGLLGLFGALIVTWAEGRRKRRNEKAALRLLSFEIIHNLHGLQTVVGQGVRATVLLTAAVWEREEVRVASRLSFKNLGIVAMPYLRLAAILRYRDGFDPTTFGNWVASQDGQQMLQAGIAEFAAAQKMLEPKIMTLRRRFDRWRKVRRESKPAVRLDC